MDHRIPVEARPPITSGTTLRRRFLVLVFSAAVVALLAVLLFGQVGVRAAESAPGEVEPGVSGAAAEGSREDSVKQAASCVGTRVQPGADLDRLVNGDPRSKATTFCLSSGTYVLSDAITLKAGDSLVGPVGRIVRKGPAIYGLPTARITDGGANLTRLITLEGAVRRVEWLDLYGADGAYTNQTRSQCANWGDVANRCPQAGTGMAIGAGQSSGSTLMRYLYVHDNDALGIGSAKGRILNSHFTRNTSNPDWLGFEAAAIKGVDEFEAARNYIHGERGNGIWCDHGCKNAPGMWRGFWAHDNVVVNNGRWGIRYEYSPRFTDGRGQANRIDRSVTALVERNRLHGNGRERGNTGGGISMEDAQNGMFRANRFGPSRMAGSRFSRNVDGIAILFAMSQRPDRTSLRNGHAVRNFLGGEMITNCSKPDTIVRCTQNR